MKHFGEVEYLSAVPGIWHELASIFPMMDLASAAELTTDIASHGVREPIVQFEGAILDGRNRYLAARESGAQIPVVQFLGTWAEARDFVLSTNLHRRHLTESQRASIAAKLENLSHGERADRRDANLHLSAPLQPNTEQDANLHLEAHAAPAVTRAEAAQMLNVSPRSVAAAKKVQDHAPAVAPLVDAGAISVSLAAQVADLPPEEIEAVAAAPVDQAKAVARQAVKRARAEAETDSAGDDSAPAAAGEDPEVAALRKEFRKLTDDAQEDDWIGLRLSLAEASRTIAAQKADLDNLNAWWAATNSGTDNNRALAMADRQIRTADARMKEYQTQAVRAERRVKALEAENKRLKQEIANQEIVL